MKKYVNGSRSWVLLILVAGCCNGPTSWRRTSEGRSVPDPWRTTLPVLGQAKATRLLKYDALYVLDMEGARGGAWYRFWPEGQGYEWHVDRRNAVQNSPSAAASEQFTIPGGAVKYCVVADKVTIESISLDEDIICPFHYAKYSGQVNEDGSFTLTFPQPGLFNPDRYMIFRPIVVGEMRRIADW